MNARQLEDILADELQLSRVKRSGQNIMACCPSHSETRPSWGISVSQPHLHACFACGYKGSLRTLLLDRGWSFERVRNLLGADPISASALSFSPADTAKKLPSEEELWPFRLEPPAVRYLKKRGILFKTMEKVGLLYHPLDRRILFPWFWENKFYGMTGRTIDADNLVKIEAYANLIKSEVLYVPNRKLDGNKPLILVEGEMDALNVFQYYSINVAALGRGSMSRKQVTLLENLPVNSRVILCFDSDEAGERITRQVWTLLHKAGFELRVVNWSILKASGKLDPGMLTDFELKTLIRSAERRSNWSI